MKKRFFFLFSLILLSGIVFSPGCTKNETTGTLSIYVSDFYTGLPIINEQVFLATSYANMQQGIYYATAFTDYNGMAFFGGISPAFYWYDTQDWQDWGAVKTVAGIDQYVFLYVNTPVKKTVK